MAPETATVPSDYSSLYAIYNQRLLTCADTYNMSTKDATALTTYNTCLSSNVTFLTSNSCPATILNAGTTTRTYTSHESCTASNPASGDSSRACGTLATWAGSNTAFTNDQTKVRNAYVDMISRAGLAAGSNTFPVQSIIEKARTADMRATSNRYLSNLCPSFFRTQSNTAPVGDTPGTYTTHNPTDYFKNYSTTSTGGTYYLDDTNRLNALGGNDGTFAAGVLTGWAKNAGNTDNELAIPNAAIVAGLSGSRYDAAVSSTVPAGYYGSAVTNDLSTACYIPNWVMALYFGPGTIAKSDGTNIVSGKIPITWRVDANTTKTCYYTPPSDGIVHKY